MNVAKAGIIVSGISPEPLLNIFIFVYDPLPVRVPLGRNTMIPNIQYFSQLSYPLWDKTVLPSDIRSRPPIRGRIEIIFLSESGGEHKNKTILSTTEIIPVICGENPKPVKLRGVIFSL